MFEERQDYLEFLWKDKSTKGVLKGNIENGLLAKS